jgi:hypothetical protein
MLCSRETGEGLALTRLKTWKLDAFWRDSLGFGRGGVALFGCLSFFRTSREREREEDQDKQEESDGMEESLNKKK